MVVAGVVDVGAVVGGVRGVAASGEVPGVEAARLELRVLGVAVIGVAVLAGA